MECIICSIGNPGNHNCENCCRACAAFFRRTIQLKLRYRCDKGGKCVISQDTRFCCRYCRMQRCIRAGMKNFEDPSSSMQFYLDDSIESHSSFTSMLEKDIFYSTDNVFNKSGNFYSEMMQRFDNILTKRTTKKPFNFPLGLAQQAMLAYENHRTYFPMWKRKNKISTAKEVDLAELLRCNFKASECVIEFCMRIRPFAELPLDQKRLLQRSFLNRFLLMEMLYETVQLIGTNVNDSRILHHNGQLFDAQKVKLDASKMTDGQDELYIRMFRQSKWLFAQFIEHQFKRLNPSRFEFIFVLLSALFDIRRPIEGISEETMEISKEVNSQLAEELYFHYYFENKSPNYAKRVYQLYNILICLQRVQELGAEESSICKTFETVNTDERFFEFAIIERNYN